MILETRGPTRTPFFEESSIEYGKETEVSIFTSHEQLAEGDHDCCEKYSKVKTRNRDICFAIHTQLLHLNLANYIDKSSSRKLVSNFDFIRMVCLKANLKPSVINIGTSIHE